MKSTDEESSKSIMNKIHSSCCMSPSSHNKKSSGLTNFLTVYFDFAYFLCFCPFRLVSDENGCFHVKTFIIQKVICGLLNILGLLLWIMEMTRNAPGLFEHRNPLNYFHFLSEVFSFTYQFLTVKQFWLRQVDFLNIVNYIKNEEATLEKRTIKVQNKIVSRIICTLFAIMTFYEVIFKKILAPTSTWHESVWSGELFAQARYTFFMANNITLTEPQEWSALDGFLAIVTSLSMIERYILGYFTDLSVFFVVITAWTATYLFAERLEINNNGDHRKGAKIAEAHIPEVVLINNGKQTNWQEIYRSYHAIRDLCHLINTTYGSILTFYLADSILFHSTGMDTVLVTRNISEKIRLMFFICSSACTFALSADTCQQLGTLKMWLGNDENRRDIPTDQLNLVMNELQFNMVGIRGSNVFTITYPLLWNVLTTVVTYFIICLQTRQQEEQQHK